MDRNARFVFSSLTLAIAPALVAHAQVDPSDLRVQADTLIKSGQFAQALPLLDQSIKLDSASSSAASSFFSRGRCLFALKRFPEALKDFIEVTRRRPKVAPGWFNRALTEMALPAPDWGGAVNSLTQVIQIDPKSRPGEQNLKLEALDRRAECYIETKIFDKAIADLNAVLALDNTRTSAWQNLAFAYTEVKPPQTDRAIEAYGKALAAATPESKYTLLLARADLYRIKQAWQPELDDLIAALKIKPGDPAVLNERASVYYRLGKFQEAAADYDAVSKLRTGPEAIEALRNKAAVLWKQKNYTATIEALTALLTKAPTDAEALKLRGAANLNLTPPNYSAAIGDYQKYVGIKPTDAAAWKDLCVAAYNSAGNPPKAGAAIDTALTAADKAIALDASAVEPLLIKAEALSIQNKPKEAIDAYTKYLAKKPDDVNAFDGRGRAYFNTQQWAQAVSDFEKVLAKTPGDADVKRLRALALAKAPGGGAAALASLKEVAEANPNDPIGWSQYGIALYKAEKYDDAMKAFTRVADLQPKGTPARLDALRNLCAAADKKAEQTKSEADQKAAVAAYTKLLTDVPNDAEAMGSRADLHLALKLWKEAIADYTKLLTLAPNGAEVVAAYNNRAICHLSLTPPDYKSAIADYGQVIAKQPGDPAAYNLRAIANLKLGDFKAAIPDLDKYLTLKPGDTAALLNRGNAYFNLANSLRTSTTKGVPEFEKAAADYATYLTGKPGDSKVLYRRALCLYRQAGDSAKPESMNKAKLQGAIAAFETASKATNPEPEAHYYLGLSCDNLGMAQDDQREPMFKKAIEAYKKYIATPGVKPEDATPVKERIALLQEEIG
jgi:tetratricopeptide (TPR) repeat protein